MKVKRYIAQDIQEAMFKVKSELGRDAIILHTRKIKKPGLRGFLKKPFIEVVAATDSDDPRILKNSTYNAENQKPQVISKSNNNSTLDTEIDSIKNMLNTVITTLNKTANNNSEILDKFKTILLDSNIDKQIADKILEIVSRQISISEKNEKSIKNAMKVIIKEYLGDPYIIEKSPNKQKVIFFVGPTGVGKTTTLAKLAAKLSIMNDKSVALITADTYRIAAVEQLKTYSEILGVPLSVVYEPKELKNAISNYNDKDYVFVDTAGRNHKNKELLSELQKLIHQTDSADIFLLISLTTGYKDMLKIIESYDFLNDYKIIFTKIDEANYYGNILNVKVLTSKPLSYITTGQSVPDDIEIADIDKIANYIVGE